MNKKEEQQETQNEKQKVAEEEKAQEGNQAQKKENQPQEKQKSAKEEAIEHTATNIQPLQDFDWEKFEEGESEYSTREKEELEELYTKNLSLIDKRDLVKGKVVKLTDNDVVLNIGFKSDGLVPLSEFKDKPDLKEGDEVEVMVEETEDEDGQLVLSHKKAQEEKAWGTIVEAHEKDKILKGYITDRTKGGMVVDLLGLDAFMPGSQIDIKPIKDYDAFVGQEMDVKVVKLNHAFRNIVVSHKAIIESDLEQQKADILSKLEKGQVLEGTIKNLTSFGVFVDLGGVDGLIHITDVSWGRINHPEEILELGQKINVVVLDYDEEKKRISLGLKQLTPHPWETLPEDIKEGTRVKGKVVNIEDYGAFVEIHPGVEGLVHVSEMSWSQHLKSPEQYVKLGDEVEAMVLSIDREERKLSLGMKQLTPDPWEKVEEKFPVNSKHQGIVRSITNFGLFMELEEGIDGLVHISDLSWTKKYNHPYEFTQIGEKLEVTVLEIDKENRRLSLGVKQLEEDPWDTFESIFITDSIHEGVVKRMEKNGAIVTMPYGVKAFAPYNHILKEDKTRVQPEETLNFKILECDKENRRLIISHTDIWKEAERAQKSKVKKEKEQASAHTIKDVKKVKSKIERSTLAEESDVLKDLKEKMKENEKMRQKEAIAEMEEKIKDKEDQPEESEEKKKKEKKSTAKKETKSSAKKTSAKKSTTTKSTSGKSQTKAKKAMSSAEKSKSPGKKATSKSTSKSTGTKKSSTTTSKKSTATKTQKSSTTPKKSTSSTQPRKKSEAKKSTKKEKSSSTKK